MKEKSVGIGRWVTLWQPRRSGSGFIYILMGGVALDTLRWLENIQLEEVSGLGFGECACITTRIEIALTMEGNSRLSPWTEKEGLDFSKKQTCIFPMDFLSLCFVDWNEFAHRLNGKRLCALCEACNNRKHARPHICWLYSIQFNSIQDFFFLFTIYCFKEACFNITI